MKKTIMILMAVCCFTATLSGQNTPQKECEYSDLILEKIYCQYCADAGKSDAKAKVTKAQYAYFKSDGKDAIDVLLLAGGTAERPDYFIHIIIPKESLASGSLDSGIVDEWGNGLDNKNSVIVKFQYRVDKGNSVISQWSNWGGHNKGQSEGRLTLKMNADKTLCGSLTVTVYEDGSSMDKNKKSIISCKSFKASL